LVDPFSDELITPITPTGEKEEGAIDNFATSTERSQTTIPREKLYKYV